MAGYPMTRAQLSELRLLLCTFRVVLEKWAARVEAAAGRRVDWVRDFTRRHRLGAALYWIGHRNGRQQSLGIWVQWMGIDFF